MHMWTIFNEDIFKMDIHHNPCANQLVTHCADCNISQTVTFFSQGYEQFHFCPPGYPLKAFTYQFTV